MKLQSPIVMTSAFAQNHRFRYVVELPFSTHQMCLTNRCNFKSNM